MNIVRFWPVRPLHETQEHVDNATVSLNSSGVNTVLASVEIYCSCWNTAAEVGHFVHSDSLLFISFYCSLALLFCF